VIVAADWPGFGRQKNRALAEARGRWVLSIDADERVSPALAAEIRDVVRAAATADGYELDRLSSLCGQWMHHGDWYPDRVLRLFKREAGRFSDDLVHERLIVDGRIARLRGRLLHHTMPTLADALAKMNRYSSGRAADQRRGGGRGGLAAALAHGAWAFVRCYAIKRGFLDGRLGLVLAIYVAEGTYYRYLKMAWDAPERAD
jgi:glycosyltransferase involved in cell wall biosynthesis